MTDPGSPNCQRWREHTQSWRHTSEGGFNPNRYDVALINEDGPVKAFVETHHYSRTYPAASLRAGLFDGNQIVGVAVFGIPMQRKVLTNAFPMLRPYAESLELSRFVLLDDVPANAETWFLARCFEQIAELGLRGVVAFADPVPRLTGEGIVLSPGHVGTIYQAGNGWHTKERGTPRTLLMAGGVVISSRSIQKIRAQERGHDYAERQLVELGARPLRQGENPTAWLNAALDDAGVRRVRHPGNFRYLFRLGNRAERSRVHIGLASAPYPKKGAVA